MSKWHENPTNEWVLFIKKNKYKDLPCLLTGLMSVTAQHLDYLRTALRTLDLSSENQYKIRGQPRADKVGFSVCQNKCLLQYLFSDIPSTKLDLFYYFFIFILSVLKKKLLWSLDCCHCSNILAHYPKSVKDINTKLGKLAHHE